MLLTFPKVLSDQQAEKSGVPCNGSEGFLYQENKHNVIQLPAVAVIWGETQFSSSL